MLLDSGTSTREQLERAAGDDLPGFIRSLVGLDRQAVQEVFADFIAETTLNDRQLRLIEMIVSQLTRSGSMGVDALYDPPFTDLAAGGPEDLFEPSAVDRLGEVIRRFGSTA